MTGTRQGRGPMELDAAQKAKLEVVRQRRIERDNGLEELEIQIQTLRETFMLERDNALRSAVWAAKDAKHATTHRTIPNSHIKLILNITDDRTYKKWLEGYVAPEPTEYLIESQGGEFETRFPHVDIEGTEIWHPTAVITRYGRFDGIRAVVQFNPYGWDWAWVGYDSTGTEEFGEFAESNPEFLEGFKKWVDEEVRPAVKKEFGN